MVSRGVAMNYPKTAICPECYASFVPYKSRIFCDVCFRRLDRNIERRTNIEEELANRKFRKNGNTTIN